MDGINTVELIGYFDDPLPSHRRDEHLSGGHQRLSSYAPDEGAEAYEYPVAGADEGTEPDELSDGA